jgi:hypothetical protein
MSQISKFLLEKRSAPVTLAETTTKSNCANCDNVLTGAYCSYCGQKKIDRHDVTIRSFIEHGFKEFTHIDSKLFKTFRYLLFKPGYLTEEYIAGHRKKYMNPVQLFIVINLIYFIVLSFFNWSTFTTQLRYQLNNGLYGHFVNAMVEKRITAEGVSFETFETRYNYVLKTQAKSLIILMVPVFSAFVALFYWRQKRYFVEHLVFSIHLYGFVLLALGMGINLMFFLLFSGLQALGLDMSSFDNDVSISLLVSFTLLAYLFLSLRQVYKNSLLLTFFKAAMLFVLFWIVLFAYRFVLFISAYYSLDLSKH